VWASAVLWKLALFHLFLQEKRCHCGDFFLFWLILTTVHFVRNDINFMPSITYLKLFVSQLRLIFTPFLRCLFTDRTPQSGASRYLNLLTGQKSAFSPRRGDSLHRFTWNLVQPMGMWVRLAVQNFMPISIQGGNAVPKWQKFPLLVKSRPAGANTFTDFYNC